MLKHDQNMGSLKKLKVLDLQSNRIVKLEALDGLENLEDLYLSHNGIERMEGLERNASFPVYLRRNLILTSVLRYI
jgi:Leucine-rich repeat (LRR) protein